jgi:hypothetical protein
MVRDADPLSWRVFLAEQDRLMRTDAARWRAGQELLARARNSLAAFR